MLDFDTALAYISINKSMNLSTLSFRITDVPEDYKEEMQRTSIEKGWKVSRTLVAFFFEIDFRLAKINISLVGRGRISNKVFIEVTG
ncbi:MAG: hypothetical protein C0180_05205 [Aciduliprofundum sp.]|nr:MAG: hypothetical protein C0180_05205 [Aciduliprofundum sp.]